MLDSPYALKTAWRIVFLVYGSCAVFGAVFASLPYWTPASWGLGEAILIVWALSLLLALAGAFAFAGAGWAVCSIVRDGVTHRQSAAFALLASLIAATTLSGYFLFFTGAIGGHNT